MPVTTLPTGIDMYYEVEGRGEPLLLIMGTAADHTPWAAQVAACRNQYTVITYDARGTGRSSHPSDIGSYSMRVLADDAAALLRYLGIERAHVSGLPSEARPLRSWLMLPRSGSRKIART